MLDFFDMMGNYELRAVARFEQDGLVIDTCAVTDAAQPYETGICHPSYNDGKWIIVELYDTREEAQIGHDKWVKTMTANELPKWLQDVSSAAIAGLCDIFEPDDEWQSYDYNPV